MNDLLSAILIGIGATILMDIWALIRRKVLKVPLADYGLVWRWMAYIPSGQLYQKKIQGTPPVFAERTLGWILHYLIGITFAFALVAINGTEWIENPTLMPALIVGIVTVIAPLFIMQPGMGAVFAASRTPRPNFVRLHSLIMHTVFGLGLYITAVVLNFIA